MERLLEAGLLEAGLLEVGLLEVRLLEVRLLEVRLLEVGLLLRLLRVVCLNSITAIRAKNCAVSQLSAAYVTIHNNPPEICLLYYTRQRSRCQEIITKYLI